MLDRRRPAQQFLIDPLTVSPGLGIPVEIAGICHCLVPHFVRVGRPQLIPSAGLGEFGECMIQADEVNERVLDFVLLLGVDPTDHVGHRSASTGRCEQIRGDSLARLAVPVVAIGDAVGLRLRRLAQPRGDAHGSGPVGAR